MRAETRYVFFVGGGPNAKMHTYFVLTLCYRVQFGVGLTLNTLIYNEGYPV